MKFDIYKSYIEMIKNSIGSEMFRSLYFDVEGETQDILRGGELSCSRFVSVILHSFYLLKESHARTESTIVDMEKSGWYTINEPRVGAVLLWERVQQKTGVYPHIGFYMGGEKAISHRDSKRTPVEHDWLYRDEEGDNKDRKVEVIYWHDKLRP